MFTGIIEEKGTIQKIDYLSRQAIRLKIEAPTILEDAQIGDSIAINGVCLTITSKKNSSFDVDVMPETIQATSLQSLQIGSVVNLERAMAANDRFGGHFVSGHVDATGKIIQKTPKENAVYYEIQFPDHCKLFFTMKGSVALDGISLTIFDVSEQTFTISLIPHTLSETTLGDKDVGDIVNIEGDMLIKHVSHLLQFTPSEREQTLNLETLKENGFM